MVFLVNFFGFSWYTLWCFLLHFMVFLDIFLFFLIYFMVFLETFYDFSWNVWFFLIHFMVFLDKFYGFSFLMLEFNFCQFKFNPFNYFTHWKQKSYFPKITSFIWPPFPSRHSVSLLQTSPITLWSISTGIRLTSCWIRCFNSWTVWGAGILKTWDFRYPQRKKLHAEISGDLAGHVIPISGDNLVRKQIPHSY